MIFYDCATAPSPRRARMFIVEKRLDIETHQISIAENEQRSDAFLAINPRATVPVLITDEGSCLSENIAIATYLEARFPNPPLMGRDADEKGRVAMWNAMAEFQCGMAVAEVLRNSHPAMKNRALPGPLDLPQIPDLAERGKARLAAFFDLLETQLQDNRWLAGDAFSLADITAFVFVDFARVIKTRIPDGNTATKAWFDRVKSRPSASA